MENINKGETLQTTQQHGINRNATIKCKHNFQSYDNTTGIITCEDCGYTETRTSKGCGETYKVSQLTDETFVCGETKLNGKIWYCNDCLTKLHTRYDKVAHCANCGELAGLKGDLCNDCLDKQEAN